MVSTDWLFLPVGFALGVFRIARGEIGMSKRGLYSILQAALPAAIALGLFAYQMSHFDLWNALYYKFIARTGIDDGDMRAVHNFAKQFYGERLIPQYGHSGMVMCLISFPVSLAALLMVYKNTRRPSKLVNRAVFEASSAILFIATSSCFLQVNLLRNHSVIHPFSALKFALVIALVPFCVAPIALLAYSRRIIEMFKTRLEYLRSAEFNGVRLRFPTLPFAAPLVIISILAYLIKIHPIYRQYKEWARENSEQKSLLTSLIAVTQNKLTNNDYVISPSVDTPINPPVVLSMVMKHIHRMSLDEGMSNAKACDCNLVILFDRKDNAPPQWKIEKIALDKLAHETSADERFDIYRFSPSSFDSLADGEKRARSDFIRPLFEGSTWQDVARSVYDLKAYESVFPKEFAEARHRRNSLLENSLPCRTENINRLLETALSNSEVKFTPICNAFSEADSRVAIQAIRIQFDHASRQTLLKLQTAMLPLLGDSAEAPMFTPGQFVFLHFSVSSYGNIRMGASL